MKTENVTDEFIDLKKLKNKKNNQIQNDAKRSLILIAAGVILFLALIFSFIIHISSFKKTENVRPLTDLQQEELNQVLNENYPEQRTSLLKKYPFELNPMLKVWAGSAVLVDASNGCILFEKNADEIIPPASITKLFVMYIVFKDAAAGKVNLDDVVPIPEKSWAVNMPRDASLMFLGQGQIVTLRELLKGLAVASGNDAALAVASYISGSTKAFVERMNEECKKLGLLNTHFVEPSGYDENNLTTAKDLAAFCCEYIRKFPEGVEEFHSAPSIKYPLQKNLPSWQQEKGDSSAIYQRNTNPLLGKMEGCDGIKTGFIYESGYNLALTAKRNGVRFISITLKGPGVGSKQGNAGRVHDGNEMMEWAFSNFADFYPENVLADGFAVPSIGAKNKSGKFVKLIPAWSNAVTVPHVHGETALDDAKNVRVNVQLPKFVYGGTSAGAVYGQIQYVSGETVLETVPLVADRTDEKAGLLGRLSGSLISWFL